jgi:hypothetical protein
VAVDREPAWHAQLIMRELTQPTPACAAFVNDFVRPSAEALAQVLDEIVPGLPRPKLLLCAFSVVGQCLHYRFARPVVRMLLGEDEFRSLDVELLTEHIHEFSLAALRSLAARRRRESS